MWLRGASGRLICFHSEYIVFIIRSIKKSILSLNVSYKCVNDGREKYVLTFAPVSTILPDTKIRSTTLNFIV